MQGETLIVEVPMLSLAIPLKFSLDVARKIIKSKDLPTEVKVGRRKVKLKDIYRYYPSLASIIYGLVRVVDPKKAKELKKKVFGDVRPVIVVKRS